MCVCNGRGTLPERFVWRASWYIVLCMITGSCVPGQGCLIALHAALCDLGHFQHSAALPLALRALSASILSCSVSVMWCAGEGEVKGAEAAGAKSAGEGPAATQAAAASRAGRCCTGVPRLDAPGGTWPVVVSAVRIRDLNVRTAHRIPGVVIAQVKGHTWVKGHDLHSPVKAYGQAKQQCRVYAVCIGW